MPTLIRNSIPKQNIGKNERLKVQSWNEYINILKEQTNANTRYLERLSLTVTGIVEGGILNTGIVSPPEEDPLQDFYRTTLPTEDEGYLGSEVGLVLHQWEI